MNRIEDIINKGRSEFDDREPSDGHFERFSFRLATRLHAGKAKRSIVPYLLKAAVVTLLVTLSSLWTFDHFVRPNLKTKMTLSEVSPEYREVEKYYVQQVNFVENEFSSLNLSTPEQKELRANPDDQRIIDAMIRHYQTKIEVMTYILDQLKEIKAETVKPESHEEVVY